MPRLEVERQQAVQNILQGMRGIEPLKKLFWTELNYDRTNSTLARKGWGEQASGALAEDPLLFATGGSAFQVIYARLKSEKLLMGMERPVVSRMLQEHPYALFVFSNAQQDRWHFLNVKYDDDVGRRRLFRRITVGPEERPYLRTASERLDKINLDGRDHSPIAIQKLHDEAFDVEPVTKEFFEEYRRIFHEVEKSILGIQDEERKRLFTQRLFNRVMFIAFIQKKGWLKFNGDTDYLNTLWNAYQRDKAVPNKNFYRDRLKLLFFSGLNTANEVNQVGINRGGFLKILIGEVPYLNGGLFEEDEDDKNSDIVVPDRALNAVLNDLFAKFNFTVTESTPLDVEVAVDPEMLGKIFEELVTGRHETGSYYTPKPIVAFMSREALKGYLEGQLPGELKQAIEEFVDGHNPANLRNAETVLEALRRVKVCDPACGSGAYLVGMLHELLDLRAALFATKRLDAKSAHDRKLEIIQTNLYGVDLDPFAVNIARLRLWLSLSVEYEGQDPPPLPNLDYKVEVGDTVCSPNPSGGLEMGFRKALIEEYLNAKAQYMTSHHGQKIDLRNRIHKLRSDIRSWSHRARASFDWPIEFAEVFIGGGFDVVLANPPYVRQELIKDIKPALKQTYGASYSGTADLYCYFYLRGVELLRPNGMLVFISSNKWLRSNYGTRLRTFLASHCNISSITDFGELPVFESAATFPMILVAQQGRSTGSTLFTQVRSLESPYPDVKAIQQQSGMLLPDVAIAGSEWKLSSASTITEVQTMEAHGVRLREYLSGDIYYGIKTGFNTAFVIDRETRRNLVRRDQRSRDIIKPLAVGDDIRKWTVRNNGRWLIVTPIGVRIKDYPAIFEHLKHWREQLQQRWDKGEEWWELRPCDYYELFERPKILFPDIAKEPRFTLATEPLYLTNTAYFIPTDDLYLLGVLNSDSIWGYAREHLAVLGDASKGGRLRFFRQFVQKIPIPKATSQDRRQIASLVEVCLTAQGKNCDEAEREINGRVARLFGLGTIAEALSTGGSPVQ